MSREPRRPRLVPEPPPGYFYVTQWRLTRNAGAKQIRDRWAGSLAVLGVRTMVIETEGYSALVREGDEALSASGFRERERDRGQKVFRKTRSAERSKA